MDDKVIQDFMNRVVALKPGDPGYDDRPRPPSRGCILPSNRVASAEKVMSFFMDDDTNQHDAEDDKINKQDSDS